MRNKNVLIRKKYLQYNRSGLYYDDTHAPTKQSAIIRRRDMLMWLDIGCD